MILCSVRFIVRKKNRCIPTEPAASSQPASQTKRLPAGCYRRASAAQLLESTGNGREGGTESSQCARETHTHTQPGQPHISTTSVRLPELREEAERRLCCAALCGATPSDITAARSRAGAVGEKEKTKRKKKTSITWRRLRQVNNESDMETREEL